jgi:hypothetical protein
MLLAMSLPEAPLDRFKVNLQIFLAQPRPSAG